MARGVGGQLFFQHGLTISCNAETMGGSGVLYLTTEAGGHARTDKHGAHPIQSKICSLQL